MTAAARRGDTGDDCELVVCAQVDGRWAWHGPDSPVVVLDKAVAVYLARWILAQDRAESPIIRWTFAPSGWVSHAISEGRYPRGVTITECGQRLTGASIRLADRPTGVLCQECVEVQMARALPVAPGSDG